MTQPRLLLHLEGAAVLLSACLAYQHVHGSWMWFGLLFLVPDFSMLGYLAGNRVGAVLYNLFHTSLVPLVVLCVLWLMGETSSAWVFLVWVAHIGWDRLVGYGLKYETAFKDTHLQRV